MMRGPTRQAIVVRKPDGALEVKEDELKLIKDRYPVLGLPLIRGVVNFGSSMANGVRALMWSAEFVPEEEAEQPSAVDRWLERRLGSERAGGVIVTLAVVLGLAFSVGLFILLPTLLAGLLAPLLSSQVARNLAEGAVRITIFLAYLFLCSRIKDIKRVFAYHGAEHKAIFCYERGLPLTVENVRAQTKHHPRCGTSFLFVVMVVSILIFSVVSWSNVWIRMALRLLLLPVVVGITYEINRLIGRYDNPVTRALTAPGLALQRWTTNEPDDSMIEVAVEALRRVLPDETGKDAW